MSRKPKQRQEPPSSNKRWVIVLLTAMAATAISLAAFTLYPLVAGAPRAASETEIAHAIDLAMVALENGQFERAAQLAAMVPEGSDAFDRSILIAGEAASREGRPAEAIALYQKLAGKTSPDALLAAFSIGEIYRSTGRLEQAAEQYRYVLRHDGTDAASHERLAFLLGITGQRWEAMPHYLALVKAQQWGLDSLAILGDLERPIEQSEFVDRCKALQPDEPWVQLAVAARALADGDAPTARPLLEHVVQERPELLAAQAMLGELLLSETDRTFQSWERSLPAAAEQHADTWLVRGLKARRDGRIDVAAGCFAETVRLQTEHRRGTYQLSQVLNLLGAPQASPLAERAARQVELSQTLDQVLRTRGADEQALQRAAELSEQLGRLWEAWAWSITAAKMHPGASWPRAIAMRAESQLGPTTPRTVPAADLLANVDLSEYVRLARKAATASPDASPRISPAPHVPERAVRFVEQTDVGIEFVYFHGPDPATPGARMFEQTGGGVGVIDYDNDGWPDLYFTQGAPWVSGQDQPAPSAEYHDCLYRNVSGDRFVEVSGSAGVQNLEFAQGIAVGDYNADGFADMLVGNIGHNRLWCNNGDGTFSDASDLLPSHLAQWTTSCVMVDLNGDGLLDLYEVNYLQGDQVFQLICDEKGCSPKNFDGAPDQLYLNSGDGTFHWIPNASPQKDAKGLGVLAAVLGDDPLPSLFIANDQVPNFLLCVEPAEEGGIRLRDRALLRGLAYNGDGLSMACMGIAADDVDGNGRIDMLVTNFADEANSLYLQDAPGLFVDATRSSGMFAPSLPYVSWGAQFLDADLDGRPDAAVVTGHVDDYRDRGGMYHMPPQFYRNVGRGRFEIAATRQAGAYFDQEFLGRGMARLDWNRDGRMDFAVSNIGSPASLVSNQSQGVGAYLNVRLHGTRSARDPIGARVTVETDTNSWTKQLVVGDGYQASNERLLQFGLGESAEIRAVTVHWPAGGTTKLTDVALDSTIQMVEGATSGVTADGSAWRAEVSEP